MTTGSRVQFQLSAAPVPIERRIFWELAIIELEERLATAEVRWVPADQGGRRSGPPTAEVYAATAAFVLGKEAETVPGWPVGAALDSILIKPTSRGADGVDIAEIGFLVPDRVRQHLHVGSELLVMEGPKVVARAKVTQVHPE